MRNVLCASVICAGAAIKRGLLVLLCCLPLNATAGKTGFLFSFATGGEQDADSIGAGLLFAKYGLGFNVAFFPEPSYRDSEISHGSPALGLIKPVENDAYVGERIGIELAKHFNIIGNSSIYVAIGAYKTKKCDVVSSLINDELFCYNEKLTDDIGGSLGYMHYFEGALMGLGWNNQKGVEITVGVLL